MGLSKFFNRSRWDEERSRELETYLEAETADNIAKGMSPAEARTAAHRKLGNPALIREEIYQINSFGLFETLWQDLRYGARMLRKSPGFTLIAVLTLALGIGANTAIFSMVDWLVFQQLPVQDPKSLIYFGFIKGGELHNDVQFSFPEYQEIAAECGSEFNGMAAAAFGGSSGQSRPDGLTYQGKTLPVQTYFTTGNFFSLLGLKPTLGRFFTDREGVSAGADPVMVLSWEYWQSRFQGDHDIIGKSVAVNGHDVTIIGVGPKDFYGPTPLLHMQAYLPLGMFVVEAGTPRNFLTTPDARSLVVFARLKPGTSPKQLKPLLNLVSQHLLERHPRPDEKLNGMSALPLRPPGMVSSESMNPLARVAIIFFILGILVLVLACVNVANLLLVRAASRQSEMAVRAALGAARQRLIRQLLTETLLLALLGGGAGIITGLLATHALAAMPLPTALPLSLDFHFDWLVFGGALFATVLASLVAGITPALQAARPDLNMVLHDSGRSLTSRRYRLRNTMVTIQVAGSLSLLIVAGLFARSLQGAQHFDVGFDPHGITNVTMDPNEIGFTEAKGQEFYRELLERARALPGVESVSLAAWLPDDETQFGGPIEIPGIETVKGQPRPSALFNAVSDGYFRTMGVPILRGRDISASDSATSPRVALINQLMADKYWPRQDPIGRQFAPADDRTHPIQIIGVVRNFRMVDPYSDIEPAYFVPLTQHYFATATLHVRSAASDPEFIRQIVTMIDSMAPTIPIYTGSMTQALMSGLFLFRLGAILTGILGAVGLFLAIIGVYGVMSYAVSQRTHEIGIRMALGAQRKGILTMVAKQTLTVVIAGLVIGALLAFGVGQIVREFLVGVSPADPITYFGVAALLAITSISACFIPARRAVNVDPIVALRNE